MNKKGQALVEFVIVMPLMVLIMFAIIDFGTYNYNKSKLEGILNNVNNMYQNNETIDEIDAYLSKNDNSVVLNIDSGDKYTKIKLVKHYDFITPGIKSIFKNNEITVERVIYNE